MKVVLSCLWALLLGCAGCASEPWKPGGDLLPYVGLWGHSRPQAGVVFASAVNIREDGTFIMKTAVTGATTEQNLLSGICRVSGTRLDLRVEISQHPLGLELPVDLSATLDDGALLFHDNPRNPDAATRYARMAVE